MASTIKSFTVTSSPVSRRGSRKAKKITDCPPIIRKHGGGDRVIEGPPVTVMKVATAGVLPLGVKSIVTGYQSPSMSSSMPLQGASLKGLHISGQMGGGLVSTDHQIHVELKKSTVPRKVHLNPKKVKQDGISSAKTKKSRKVILGINALHNRVTRAKKIREKVKVMPLDDLRKELIKRGLIKESSKAPESILRQIAADAQIVSGKGL